MTTRDSLVIKQFGSNLSFNLLPRDTKALLIEMATCIVARTKQRTTARTETRARAATLAGLIRTARDGGLDSNSMIGNGTLTSYVNLMKESGLIQEIAEKDTSQHVFRATSDGLRFIDAYENLDRVVSLPPRKTRLMMSGYYRCQNCRCHPLYPHIYPVTLHEDGICLICHSKA
ncbi:MAG: hypothetical protein ACREBS_03865 [Nitrososphaerales archaeon]